MGPNLCGMGTRRVNLTIDKHCDSNSDGLHQVILCKVVLSNYYTLRVQSIVISMSV